MDLLAMKTATITNKGQISIPQEIRRTKGFKTGEKVILLAFKDRVEIRPLQQVKEQLFPALATEQVLKREWLSKEEEEAWKDL